MSSLRESSCKTISVQNGQKNRLLSQTEQAVEVYATPLPALSERCDTSLLRQDLLIWNRRQVFDMPSVAFDMIEQRTFVTYTMWTMAYQFVFGQVSEPL